MCACRLYNFSISRAQLNATLTALAEALDSALSLDPAERAVVAARARARVETDYRSEVCSIAWHRTLRKLAFPGAGDGVGGRSAVHDRAGSSSSAQELMQ